MNCRVCGKSLHLICNFEGNWVTHSLRHSRFHFKSLADKECVTDGNERLEPLTSLSKSRISVLRRIEEVQCCREYGMSFKGTTEEILSEHRRLTKQGKISKRDTY